MDGENSMELKPIVKYLKSLIIHKFYVLIACFKCGLYWRGIVHDICKLHPIEFRAYVKKFGTKDGINAGRDSSGFYEPLDDDNMKEAWKHHCHSSSHHWQYHCVARNRTLDGAGHAIEVLDMPLKDIEEMLADWWAASKAYNGNGIAAFWKANNRRMRFSNKTRKIIVRFHIDFEKFLNGEIKIKPDLAKKSLSDMTIFLKDVD
jgi:hypothetical protein